MGDSYTDFDRVLEAFSLGFDFAELGFSAVLLTISAVTAIVGFIFTLAQYLLAAYPVYKLSKKLGRKYAFLAWIPVFSSYFRMFVIADMAGDKEAKAFGGKVTIKNRFTSFWIYLLVAICGGAILSFITLVLNIIPGLGQILSMFSSVLHLVPAFVAGVFEYVYLRDMLDIFKADKKNNNTVAIVVTVIDAFVGGWAKVIYFYTMLKLEPLPQSNDEPIEATASESAAV